MKRLTLLTILLVVVGLASGFALEVKPSFTLSGSGMLQWGYDLDNMGGGFLNTQEADLTVTLMAADGTDTHAGTEGFYGSIVISNVEMYFHADEATAGHIDSGSPSVTATIVGMGGNLVIGVFDAPDLALDFVGAIENDDVDDTIVDVEAEIGTDYGTYGTFLSYTLAKDITVGLEMVSADDWVKDWGNDISNAYAFALDVLAKVSILTINAGVNYGFGYASDPIGVGVKVAADTAMIDPWVAFDAAIDGGFAFEVGGGATITFMETVTAAISAFFDSTDNLDLKFVFTEPAAKGLVDKMDASLTVYVLDLIGAGNLEYEVILAAGYDTGKLYPHFGVTYGDEAGATDPILKVYAHVDYDLFAAAATVLSLNYDSGDLLSGGIGTIVAGVKVSY